VGVHCCLLPLQLFEIQISKTFGNEELGISLPSWPSIKFYPDGSVRRILDKVMSQHFALVYGDYVDELLDLCYLLDIKPILEK